ncbi:MAG: HAD hydrolase family protein [Janthinobacterium lividum]
MNILKKNTKICIDIDGTICELRRPEQSYEDLKPLDGAASKIKDLKDKGAYIIFCTARHMETCDSNVGKVIARQGQTLLKWLEIHGFVYDEIWFGKPNADVYIDDKAIKFEGSWDTIHQNLIQNYL